MSFSGKKVSMMLRMKGIKAKDFYTFVYPERTGNASFSDIEKNDNPKAKSIELMADMLHCSIDELFDRGVSYPVNSVNGDNNTVGNIYNSPEMLNAEIQHLKEIIERQDATIADQNRRIDFLIGLKSADTENESVSGQNF